MKNICLAILTIAAMVCASVASANPTFWDKLKEQKVRFKVLHQLDGAAVLDRETGLIWEQSPDITTDNWFTASFRCNAKAVGNRKGWGLPTIQELQSIVDPTQVNPTLPIGHPFDNVQTDLYWSATTFAPETNHAWSVSFASGGAQGAHPKPSLALSWCVRGGRGVDPQ